MKPFHDRLCICTHARHMHRPEWGWTTCTALRCPCIVFRWVRVDRYWQWRHRRAQQAQRRANRGRRG